MDLERRVSKGKLEFWATTTTLGCVAGLFSIVAVAAPRTFRSWMQEDSWVEWATFWGFLVAGILYGLLYRHGLKGGLDRRRHLFAAPLLGLAVFCLFVAGEEISWTQRLFAFKPPDVFLEKNFQQELNLHNLLKDEQIGGFKLDSRHLVALIAVGFGVMFPASRWLKGEGLIWRLARVSGADPSLMGWFAIVAWVELSYPVSFTGEAAECFLGLLFVADATHRARAHPWSSRGTRAWPSVLRPVSASDVPRACCSGRWLRAC